MINEKYWIQLFQLMKKQPKTGQLGALWHTNTNHSVIRPFGHSAIQAIRVIRVIRPFGHLAIRPFGSFGWMAKWPNDRMAEWPNGRMTEWPNDRMTKQESWVSVGGTASVIIIIIIIITIITIITINNYYFY